MTLHSEFAIEFTHVDYAVSADHALLSDLNLSVRPHETLVLLGQSGSGKTTTLKLINLLLVPTSGEVRVEGRSTLEWNPIRLRRRIGYAVQEVGLFPHYTVEENVALVPKAEKWDKRRIRTRVEDTLALVGLQFPEFADRYPHELSGGQRQRVGLARALAANPPFLLMDEPFGALDPITRAQLQREFATLSKRLGTTVVFVTHDVAEALLLGDRIALIENGSAAGVYSRSEFLASSDETIRAYRETSRLSA
ncbi:MAG TPA: ATP-binding cassette domain-containing protein [Candidatus Acidoferrales bacterium]|nr:ATP-binding cassette domain-containing protein [Candidatus Acidoferrales bacterium]